MDFSAARAAQLVKSICQPVYLRTLPVLGLVVFSAVSHSAIASPASAAQSAITIENSDGTPLANAEILIGSGSGLPLANSHLRTDVRGTFAIPSNWTTPESLTIIADGYIRATFLNVAPQPAVYEVNLADAQNQLEIKGTTTGFDNIEEDGKIDFGLVYPALTRRQLAQFDVSSVVSSQFDKISVFTESISIPSNVTLPDQTENYILPIELNKPDYRMYVARPGQYKMVAVHGQFPFHEVVNELRGGKSFYDVINRFKFLGGGERAVNVASSAENQDIAVDQNNFKGSIEVQAPNLDDGIAMVSLPLVNEDGLFYSTDLKQVDSGSSEDLSVPSSSGTYDIISLLTHKTKKISSVKTTKPNDMDLVEHPELAFELVVQAFFADKKPIGMPQIETDPNAGPGGQSVAVQNSNDELAHFIPLVARPVMNSDGSLTLTPPAAADGIQPVATYVVLSRIDHIKAGKYQVDRRFRMYEAYSQGWISSVKPPNVIPSLQSGNDYRWEVYYMGRRAGIAPSSNYFLDSVTHVSRNSIDFTE